MAGWILTALQLLARLAPRAGGLARRGALPFGAAAIGSAVGLPGIPGIDLFPDDDKPKRRRRRRALTASDRADIAFIESILGKSAGKSFAMIIATRA